MDLHDLDLDQNKDFLVAGKGGVYRLSQEEVVLKGNKSAGEVNYSKEDIQDLFAGEPTIEQVQGAAMEYSETNMNKIKSWRRQARLRALFPSFSLGYNKSIYGSSSGAMAVGPRDWDIAFSWDVGDLVWNSDQTSIDSRSRLTVQLRQDVLDQLNSLYYERRRLKAEMLLSPPVDDVEELYRDFEIQQLTANIDALTGNFFSRVLRRKDS
jgi:hypothetical protein